MGYDLFHKGYVLFDLKNNKTLISRDVKFCTHQFPYLNPDTLPNHDDSLPMVPLETPITE